MDMETEDLMWKAIYTRLQSHKSQDHTPSEVNYGNSFIEWFSEQARNIRGEILQSPVTSKKLFVEHHPIGVAALITPWNFPHAMITRKAGAALSAGCTCVIKPAEDTPLTALALMRLAEEAGIPKGVLNVVTSSREHAPAIGKLQQVDGGFFEKFGSLFREQAEFAQTQDQIERERVALAAAEAAPKKEEEETCAAPETEKKTEDGVEGDETSLASSDSDSEVAPEKDDAAELIAAAFNVGCDKCHIINNKYLIIIETEHSRSVSFSLK
ncbi:unnamed protein product [Callosobruchus maculatus]|uniref:Aldehyde dehydrogenase domain-containing protein n=1 Tax=Callosobruchus maculatus TaxID=64391 RepID=A0A653BDG9_CALMS|nr:unnamed protein product [Callosobruchus maculatus]